MESPVNTLNPASTYAEVQLYPPDIKNYAVGLGSVGCRLTYVHSNLTARGSHMGSVRGTLFSKKFPPQIFSGNSQSS
jgi:hypothetical protein